MSRFIQLHLLTSYPPANLNRDDLGRPKTAVMGGVERLRVSSQSLKRSWRCSDLFKKALDGHVGTRTKEMGHRIQKRLIDGGIPEKKATDWAGKIAGRFGKLKKDGLEIEQLAHFSPEEVQAVEQLTDALIERKSEPEEDELKLLRDRHSAADIALFGRMLAASTAYNVEAACQVAHAISVHRVTVEDDFFTAVDDLNTGEEDVGAGHMGETEFAAGLFYLYLCIDRELLIENLGGDSELADKALAALVESAATVSPTGKQNSFGSRARASFMLAEAGDQQPRSLSVAFLKPISGQDMLSSAIAAMQGTRENMDKVYGACSDDSRAMNAVTGEGSLQEIIGFAGRHA
jgi:CRISPR system Cascade subunit CasC